MFGLGTTIVVMNVFEAAQPALLYIVPAVLAAVLGHAAINKQFLEVRPSYITFRSKNVCFQKQLGTVKRCFYIVEVFSCALYWEHVASRTAA